MNAKRTFLAAAAAALVSGIAAAPAMAHLGGTT